MKEPFVLREIRETDLADIVEACNDPATQRFLPLLPSPYTEADARVFMSRNGGWQRIVADSDSGRLLGTVGLEERGAGEAEVGYWTAPWARGRGVATAAAGLLAARAFEAGFMRVYLRTALDNGPSQRVALNAGFQREGVSRGAGRRRDGSHYDLVVWGRLAGDPPGPARRLLGVTAAGDTLELRARPDVSARSGSAAGPDRAMIEQMCANAEARWLAGERAVLTIRDAATDTYAGEIGIVYTEPQVHQAMISYSLAPQWRGRGYASRAVRLVAAWAFDQVGVVRLTAGTAPDNIPSQRVLEAAGFTREAYQRALLPGPDGTRIDNIMYVRYIPRLMTP